MGEIQGKKFYKIGPWRGQNNIPLCLKFEWKRQFASLDSLNFQ